MTYRSGTRGLYFTPRWRELRRQVLARDPQCRGPCGGVNASRIADHITPAKDGGEFWDQANLQGLCHRCHKLKSRIEQGARGELPASRGQVKALVPGCDPTTGLPLDSGHWWA